MMLWGEANAALALATVLSSFRDVLYASSLAYKKIPLLLLRIASNAVFSGERA